MRAGRALSRRYRNRRIGELLKELELTEGRGTGIPKIQRAMRKNGSPEPIFEFDEDHSYFAVILPIHPMAEIVLTPEVTPEVGTPVGKVTPEVGATVGEVSVGASENVTPEVTPEVVRLLEIMDGEMTRAELQAALSLRDPDHFRVLYLRPALEAGLIEMTRPEKPRSSRQRYRLTEGATRWWARLAFAGNSPPTS